MKKILIILMFMISCLISTGQTRDTCLINTIQFEVNSTIPIENDNYELFINNQLQYLIDNRDDLKYIYISGAASPEGSLDVNKKLAHGRLQAVKNIISIPSPFIYTRVINEDWDGLYKLIKESDHPQKEKILNILNTSTNPKTSLIKMGVWHELIKDYFSQLRTAHIEMHFSHIIPQRDTIEIERIDTVYIKDTIYLKPKIKIHPILSLKSNAVSDILIAPNLQAELYTYLWGTSVEFEYTHPWWSSDVTRIYYQILNGTVGLRKYKDNNYKGWYGGVYGQTGYYDLMFVSTKGWQGEHWGVGLSCGYVWRKGWWRFEPYIRIGYLNSRYDIYQTGDPFEGKYYYIWNQKNEDFVPRRFNLHYVGPTMIGFNISYDLIRVKKYEGFE